MREIGISPRFSRDKFVPLQTKQRYSTRDISGEVSLTLFFRGFVPFLSLADFVSRNKNLQVSDLQRLKSCFGELVTATIRKVHPLQKNHILTYFYFWLKNSISKTRLTLLFRNFKVRYICVSTVFSEIDKREAISLLDMCLNLLSIILLKVIHPTDSLYTNATIQLPAIGQLPDDP